MGRSGPRGLCASDPKLWLRPRAEHIHDWIVSALRGATPRMVDASVERVQNPSLSTQSLANSSASRAIELAGKELLKSPLFVASLQQKRDA